MAASVKPEANDTAPRAALYLRVSTGRQAEADLSIPDQRRQALAFCAARGWGVAIEFVEPGASGMDERRPELQRLLDMALTEAPPFSVVVAHSFSRFARDHFAPEFQVRRPQEERCAPRQHHAGSGRRPDGRDGAAGLRAI
jgi:site-specific DNA recombinase